MKRPYRSDALAAAGPITAFLGGLLYIRLMSEAWIAETLGPICRHGGLATLQCPACYAALAMVATG